MGTFTSVRLLCLEKATTVQDRSDRKMPHRRATDTEPTDRILFLAVQLQGQWRSISIELSPDRRRGWPSHPSQRSGGCSTVTEEREVSWSRQHPSKTGPSRWRGCNHRSHNNLQQDLADKRMANPVDPVLSHRTSLESHPNKVLYHVFIDFKKAFDRVWHAAL